MKALITGASSGIGRDMARVLSKKGYDLILVARRYDRLEELKEELRTNVEIISLDLSSTYNCVKLYNKVKNDNINILINNAGFGLFGQFYETNLDKELDMIDINIKAVHTLTKLFIRDFIKKDQGYILNVSSSAAFSPGPLMSCYYASKSYILRLTEGIYGELKQVKSNVYIGCLCPGPVSTEFNDVAHVIFNVKPLSSEYVAKYAVEKMFKRKVIIIPGFIMKLNYIFNRFLPLRLLLNMVYKIQEKKKN